MEAELAPLAPVAALLVAAERRVEIEAVVDRHPARADPAGDGAGLLEVGGRDIAREAVLGVVGDLDGLVDVVVAEDHSTGPKISSRAMVMSLVTLAKTVGFT